MKLQINHLHELNDVISKYNLSKDDICIVGSSALTFHGIRENNDIDIIIKKSERDKIFNDNNTKQITKNIELVSSGWLPNTRIKDDEIILNRQYFNIVEGYKVVKLELLMARKMSAFAAKDQKDMYFISEFIKNNDYLLDHSLIERSSFKPSLFKRIIRKIIRETKGILKTYIKQIKKHHWMNRVNNEFTIMQHTEKFLASQFKSGKFNRYDTIVRYLAVGEHLGGNDFGFKLYRKMQESRGCLKGSEERFRRLIDSIVENGFDECSVLPVGKNQELVDGSHRLALALYFDEKLIPLKLNRYSYDIAYGIDWFKKNDFTNDEIKVIEDTKEKIFYEKGIYFQVILWPPINKYFDEIKDSLSNKYKIINNYTLDLNENLRSFVFDVYSSDDIDDWKIEKKLSGFENYGNVITVIELEIANPRFRRKGANNHYISQEVEDIKKEYRARYQNKIDNYFYDIIMHIGDNYHHTREIAKVLEKEKLSISPK